MLKSINMLTATFTKAKPQELIFTVDVFPETSVFDSPNHQKAQDYRELCEQSGWHFVTSRDKLQVFYAYPNENPIPIQTDNSVPEKIIRKSILSTEFIVFLIALPAFILQLGGLFSLDYTRLFTNTGIVSVVFFPLATVPVVIYGGYYGYWFWQAKRNARAVCRCHELR